MIRAIPTLVALTLGGAALLFSNAARAIPFTRSRVPPVDDDAWALPASAAPYADAIRSAERRNDIPNGILGRLLWQESRFRPDIIEGRTVSSAGAIGIAQIVPRWHPTARPLDPFASIDYAANYLRRLKEQFGSWEAALAAYNWGPGNLRTAQRRYGDDLSAWLPNAPRETRNYVTEIGQDTGLLA